MNKKNLIKETEMIIKKNNELFNDNTILSKKVEEYKKETEIYIEKIAELEKELADCKAELENCRNFAAYESATEDASAIKTPEVLAEPNFTVSSKAHSSDDTSQNGKASVAIGKAVIRCAEVCNLFAKSAGVNAKDLINLALGRTEVFKSEVLSAIGSSDFEDVIAEKTKNIFDYFDLLVKQLS